MMKRYFRSVETKEAIEKWPWVREVSVRGGVPIPTDSYKFTRQTVQSYSVEDLTEIGLEEYTPEQEAEQEQSNDPHDFPLVRWRFFAMLKFLGKEAAVKAELASISDLMERAVAESKVENTQLFHRGDPLIETFAPAVGLSDAQIDAAWLQAKDIE